jgi:hypothetical protein
MNLLENGYMEDREGKWVSNMKMDLMKTGYECASWMELTQDHVQWWTLVLMVLILWVLVPETRCNG